MRVLVDLEVQPSHWFTMGILCMTSQADAANMEKQEKPNFNVNFGHFKTLSDAEKDKIYSKKKVKATNDQL